MLTLLTLPLASKRDVLLARQRARQVAILFHFEAADQACVAAGTFAVAARALRHCRSAQLSIQIENRTLHIFARPLEGPLTPPRHGALPESSLRLAKPLPAAADLAAEDLSWLLQQLNQQECFRLFEEIEHQNEEMLALLHALHTTQVQLGHLQESQPSPRAA